VRRATETIHGQDDGGHVGQERQRADQLGALSEDNRATAIKASHAAHRLAQVDPKNRYFH